MTRRSRPHRLDPRVRWALALSLAVSWIANGAVGCSKDEAARHGDDAGFDDAATAPVDASVSSFYDGGADGGAEGASVLDAGRSVLEFQNGPRRDGLYVEPTFTHTVAAKMAVDTTFDVPLDGPVYAQPLYVEQGPNGRPTHIVVTHTNTVVAIDEESGSTIWKRVLGPPATGTIAGCGFSPIGITGTPAIDLARRTIYLDSAIGGAGASGTLLSTHLIHALSIDDGSERPGGWPIDTRTIKAGSVAFDATVQNQRGAALVHDGRVYFAYASYPGSCGHYRGWVVGIPLDDPSGVTGLAVPWKQEGLGAGMWAPPGPTTDGTDLFIATGNGGDGTDAWAGGEAVLRVAKGPTFSTTPKTTDYFAPSNWKALSTADQDLGCAPAIPIDVPGTSPSKLVAAFGKNGVAYILDRSNLGGIGHGDGGSGEGLASVRAVNGFITGGVAAYRAPDGSGTFVVVRGGSTGVDCPGTPGDLVGLKVAKGTDGAPTLSTAWCSYNVGAGSPIVTTTDGIATPILWTFGWYGPYLKLFAFDGETGKMLLDSSYTPADASAEVHRWAVPIVVRGKIYGASMNRLYRYRPS